MKKIALLMLCFILLCGCRTDKTSQKQYTATFLDLFDTVTTIVGKAESKEVFEESLKPVHEGLEYYHKLFDIYDEYDGITNLKTVNEKAAISPVVVDTAILDLLQDCKEYYTATNGKFNPAMGSILSLWHNAREEGINDPENAYLPDMDRLLSAKEHINPDDIVLDRENSTVFFKDADLRLDVGGIAKGLAG